MNGALASVADFSGLNVGEAQRVCVSFLKENGIDQPVLEARILLGYVLGGGPERVLADRDETLSQDQAARVVDVLNRRCRHTPMAHITGLREFWSLPFKVTPVTLIPRPDSETLVEAALDHVVNSPANVLDLGTGSGCLVLALLSEWRRAHGTAVDASAPALAVAMENAKALGLADRITPVQADWTEDGWMDALNGPFDVIVSNPPYIPSSDIENLHEDVRAHDPWSALDGGASGLDAYRVLAPCTMELLKPGGVTIFEVGIGQAEDVSRLLSGAGLVVLETRADLGGVVRVVIARKS